MIATRRAFLGAGAALPFLRAAARAEANGGVLRYGLSAFPPNLLPWNSVGASAGTVKMLIHRRLVAYDRDGNLTGELARSWGIDPDGAWVFRLRPDAVFHNGERVTADDVKWTIEQIAGEHSTAYMRAQFQTVGAIDVPDPLTVRITTKDRVATLPTWFGNYDMPIVWRKSAPNEAIGAGPFKLAGQERGTSIDLVPFAGYWIEGLPKLRGIHLTAYADDNLRIAALRAGDVDIIEYVPWQSMASVETDPRLKLETQYGPFMDVLFNGTRPPFSDARVRRAVAHAVRREEIVQAAFFGRGKMLEGVPIVEGTPWYDDKLAHGWNYDPARAKQLLA
ncbi:MAG: peptide ABC transporter substrate-binding protein, partial [Acetobacteraceae bacterium]|nr:peptide ABC transporter substrate-binding protein [Acetobacteraceae bacterium]